MKRSIYFAAFFAISMLFLASSSIHAQQAGNGMGNANAPKINWVDADGDGICDNFGTGLQGSNMNANGKRYGLKNGTGTQQRPQDGTGFGAKAGLATGTGTCDGSGPKGGARRGGK